MTDERKKELRAFDQIGSRVAARTAVDERRMMGAEIATLKARIAELEVRVLDPETLEVAISGLSKAERYAADHAAWSKTSPGARVVHAANADCYATARAKLEAIRDAK